MQSVRCRPALRHRGFPPPCNRVQLLEDIGALDEREHLTSLGRHLAALPLPPALGKMLLYACLFSCLDPVLTVACCMAYRWVRVGVAGGRGACSSRL
jgi:ATP-dependent RNA helicase DHX36